MQNPKIPLNERLKLAKSGSTPFLSAYELTAADISSEIHKVTGIRIAWTENLLLPRIYTCIYILKLIV